MPQRAAIVGGRAEQMVANLDEAGLLAAAGSFTSAADLVDASRSEPVHAVLLAYLPDPASAAATIRDRWPDCSVIVVGPEPEGSFEHRYMGESPPPSTVASALDFAVVHRPQAGYPMSGDEPQRIEAVHRFEPVLDALAEKVDAAVDRAMGALPGEIAFASVIGANEQRIKSARVGETRLDVDPIRRSESICAYTIQQTSGLVLTDAMADDRFAGNEALRAVGIRGYAGAVIAPGEGRPIGTLCVATREPHRFTDNEHKLLYVYADWIADHLESAVADPAGSAGATEGNRHGT